MNFLHLFQILKNILHKCLPPKQWISLIQNHNYRLKNMKANMKYD